ncbi:MAG: von Willebrand factor type A domain-containing protein [Chloroflexota bacterium]
MKRQIIILTLLVLTIFIVAIGCSPDPVTETIEVEVTRVVTETVEVEGEVVEVTVVNTVVEEVVQEVVVVESEAADEAMEEDYEEMEEEMADDSAVEEAPIAVAPLPQATPEPLAQPPSNTFFEDYGVNPFISTQADRLSTFSLDVDTGSYTIARRYINDGLRPPAEAIRVEEFVNAIDQGYQSPPETGFAVYADGAPSPFHNDGTHFIRIGVQGYDVDAEVRPAAALTFVIDVSGSMAAENRLGLVKQSLELLVEQMRPDDTIAIVVYGSDARVVLSPTSGSDKNTILNGIYSLQTEGSTNLEAGLLLGYEMANLAYKSGGINRVILASDGVANVGSTGPDSIVAQIRGFADSGIHLTTIGFGLGNFNDVMMEQLADQGDGAYAYIDSLDEAERLFVEEMMSTLQTIALDAKIQVEFDPNVVQQYRLIGYENRAIADNDFRNDSVDAAEFGAGHTAVAIYAVQFVPGAQGRIATVNLRWQNPDTRQVQEISGTFGTDDLTTAFDIADPYFQTSVVASQFAELLRESYWADGMSYSDLRIWADRLASQTNHPDVVELAELIRRLAG